MRRRGSARIDVEGYEGATLDVSGRSQSRLPTVTHVTDLVGTLRRVGVDAHAGTPVAPSSRPLASTGMPVGQLVGGAALLLLVGGSLLLLSRSRRTADR